MRHFPRFLALLLLFTAAPAPLHADEPDLASPRATVETFLDAMDQIDAGRGDVDAAWQRVAATMPDRANGIELDEGEQQFLAKNLRTIFTRLGTRAELGELPTAAQADADQITRYVYFPSPHHGWVSDALHERGHHLGDERIVLERTRADPPIWRFSRETLGSAHALAERLQPLPPHRAAEQARPAIPDDVLGVLGATMGETFQRTTLWGWIALFIAILIGLTAGKVAGAILRRAGSRLRNRGWEARALAFEDAANPASLALLTTGLVAGLRLIHLTEEMQEFVAAIITFLYLIALGWLLFNLVNILELALLRFAKEGNRHMLETMVVPLIRRAIRIFVVVVFTLVVAQNVFGLNITGWIAGLGIAGLAISLAAQSSVQNLFGSITVFFDKPFAVGDMITFEGETGIVEEIGFRSTKLRLFTGAVITIPNMKFIDSSVQNISRRQAIRRNLDLSITYDTPPEKIEQAVQIVRDILYEDEVAAAFDMEERPPRVYFNSYNADNLNIMVVYWYMLDPDAGRDWWAYNEHQQLVNMKVFRAFESAGIEFAFPTQTLYLASDPQRKLAVSSEL